MNYIFWGFFFVILDFNIVLDNVVIGLLPRFCRIHPATQGA